MIKAARLTYTPPLLAVVSHGVAVATYEDVSSTGRGLGKRLRNGLNKYAIGLCLSVHTPYPGFSTRTYLR
ncbi:MAG: hypothetical protein U9N55_09340 [candidate division Zixibacteria bacterium]|nr:hypothetical protein [candidate division Zixibacteria bacterium]